MHGWQLSMEYAMTTDERNRWRMMFFLLLLLDFSSLARRFPARDDVHFPELISFFGISSSSSSIRVVVVVSREAVNGGGARAGRGERRRRRSSSSSSHPRFCALPPPRCSSFPLVHDMMTLFSLDNKREEELEEEELEEEKTEEENNGTTK